jgi:hypothetical protein
MGGKSKSESGSAQKWAQPFASHAASQVSNVFDQQWPQIQENTRAVNSTIPGIAQQYQGWQPQAQQAQGYYSDVLSGKFLDPSNTPGIRGLLDTAGRDVTDRVNAQFSMGGRYGSGAHTGVLTRELAEAENPILYDAYNRERGYQDQAAQIPGQMQNQSLAQLLQAAGVGAELPFVGTNALSSGLGSLFSGGTQTQKQGALGPIMQGLGTAASSAAMFSDRRLKSNIVKIGEFDDGLGQYEYDIFGERQRGVMADEVERLRPWALGPVVDGFKTVLYGEL